MTESPNNLVSSAILNIYFIILYLHISAKIIWNRKKVKFKFVFFGTIGNITGKTWQKPSTYFRFFQFVKIKFLARSAMNDASHNSFFCFAKYESEKSDFAKNIVTSLKNSKTNELLNSNTTECMF